jgi:polyphosphate:AMP phosphotransferase
MFESANLDHRIGKDAFQREAATLREALLNAQYDIKESGTFPVVILIAGVEGAGKGESVNLLNEWMDPRHIRTHAFSDLYDEERERPLMWRYWRALPPKGSIGIFFGAWHTLPIVLRVQGVISKRELGQYIGEIQRLEKMLSDEGVMLVKFWFHLSKDQQKQRLKALEKDPKTAWRVTDMEWKYFKQYDKFVKVCEPFLRETSTGEAPWIVVPGMDARYRSLTVGRHLLAAMRARLGVKPSKAAVSRGQPLLPPADKLNVLRALELDQKMTRKEYEREIEKWQGRLNLLTRDKRYKALSVIAAFEGNDAAGKGGAIRRVTGALDARLYQNVSVAAPTQEERAQPYLWRFWRHVPRRGRITIFDRTWYGRVLVERVEKFCSDRDWMRAYAEINDFEQQLTEHNVVLVKFWLAISKAEQYKRFKARELVSFKRFKITQEDWRNRKQWDDYEIAVSEMVDRTSTATAPWTLVEANNKYFARIKVLRTLVAAIESGLKRAGSKS